MFFDTHNILLPKSEIFMLFWQDSSQLDVNILTANHLHNECKEYSSSCNFKISEDTLLPNFTHKLNFSSGRPHPDIW